MKRLIPLVLLAACGGDADAPAPADSAQVAVDTTPVIPMVGPDTVAGVDRFLCADGRAVMATYYRGPGNRVVLATEEGPNELPQVEAASGARYATPDGKMEWWSKGDSATWRDAKGQTACGPNSAAVL